MHFNLKLLCSLCFFLVVKFSNSKPYIGPADTIYTTDCKKDESLQCLQSGCVWHEDESHTPRCFYESSRYDCLPASADVNREACVVRGCTWDPTPSIPKIPWCYHKLPSVLIDCHPQKNANRQRCESRGCMWAPKTARKPFMPWCFFHEKPEKFAGYDLISNSSKCEACLDGTLQRRESPTVYGNDYSQLKVHVVPITNSHVRITIGPEPEQYVSHSQDIESFLSQKHDISALRFKIVSENEPFGIAVQRRDNNVTIFDTRGLPGFTFAKQYLQISSFLGSSHIYGLGETANPHFRRSLEWGDNIGLFSRDIAPLPKVGVRQQQNLYGVHPVYLAMEEDGKAHGVYWNNMHGLNIQLQPDPNVITYRSMGGYIDFHVFVGDSPSEVVGSYIDMIGKPYLPPYWGLGFQLSKYGYTGTDELNATFLRNQAIGIPQDVQYIDIDYMHEQLDFTYDKVKFAGLDKFVDELHRRNVRLVLITDPGIASRKQDYGVYTRGLDYAVFIKNSSGADLEGKVWPGITVYPDFTHPNATKWWLEELRTFHEEVPFAGMWYDMNEVSNFVPGSLDGCPSNDHLNHPPYIPIMDDPIYTKTLCMDALSYGGKQQFEMHSLYGYHETRVSHEAHLKLFPGKRPFMLSRSTVPGSGVHTAHWSGDVFSQWDTLVYSIVNMLEFSMYGMPWTGSDICGFNAPTTEELCVRWQQLGSFYPFSRNHNSIGVRDQDPAVWNRSAQNAMREALMIRYKYLPYMYSLLVRSSMDARETFARPLFFNFPKDTDAFGIDSQFMLGSGIMVAPVVDQGSKDTTIYFPKGRWFGLELSNETIDSPDEGMTRNYKFEINQFGLFSLGGSILPWQTPSMTTTESRENSFGLLVSFGDYNSAKGELFFDDGESTDSYDKSNGGEYKHFKFNAAYIPETGEGFLTIQKTHDSYNAAMPSLDTVQLKGFHKVPSQFFLEGIRLEKSQVREMPNSWVDLINLKIPFGTRAETNITWR